MQHTFVQKVTPGPSSPRIGIIGSGAIGGFYGLMLARAGFEVHFLLRSEYSIVASHGLLVQSHVHGDLYLRKVNAWRRIEEMPPCDWLLLGTKSTSNAALAPSLVRAAAPGAKILVLQNGLGVEDQLRPLLPPSLHLIGGLCYICTLRKEPGVIEHQALGDVHLGYHSGPAAGREEQSVEEQQAILESAAALFRTAGITAEVVSSLAAARWQKLVWNIPFNGLSALLNSGTSRLARDPGSRELILDIMHEVITAAAKCGHPLPAELPTRALSGTQSLPDYMPSMYLDYMQGRPMELAAIYEAPLAAARQAGYKMPKVEALYQALRFLDARNTAESAYADKQSQAMSA